MVRKQTKQKRTDVPKFNSEDYCEKFKIPLGKDLVQRLGFSTQNSSSSHYFLVDKGVWNF